MKLTIREENIKLMDNTTKIKLSVENKKTSCPICLTSPPVLPVTLNYNCTDPCSEKCKFTIMNPICPLKRAGNL